MRTGIDRFFLNFTEKVKVPRGVFTGAKRNTEGRSEGLLLIMLVFIPHSEGYTDRRRRVLCSGYTKTTASHTKSRIVRGL